MMEECETVKGRYTGRSVALDLGFWLGLRRFLDSVVAVEGVEGSLSVDKLVTISYLLIRKETRHTLVNQSDSSDLVEKSFSNCCSISRAF